jgi:hypothetical protein
MRAVVDTNVLIYDTFEDSVYHSEAKNLLDTLEQWILPVIVIHEYVWALKSLKISPSDVLYKVEEYLQHHKTKLIGESAKSIISALNIVVDENLTLSRYNDKVILSLALERGYNLATFDEKLRKQAVAAELKVLPELG